MAHNKSIERYKRWYGGMIRLYSKRHYERFGEGMVQTFCDVLRERADHGRGLFGQALRMYIDTSAGIITEQGTALVMRHKNIITIAIAVGLLLLIPLMAMQFTDEVNWSVGDFVVMGILLFGAGLAYELVAKRGGNVTYRAAVGVAVGAGLFLIWANLAVGLIGSGDNPVNVLYDGVVVIGVIGGCLARLRAQGMAWTLSVMAVAQALVPAIALSVWMPTDLSMEEVVGVVRVTGFFVMAFVVSAMLFWRAAEVVPEMKRVSG